MGARKSKSEQWSYEETLANIEAIIEQIESGEMPLEEVFNKFAVAVENLRRCEDFLNRGKEKMELLIEDLGDT